MAKARPRGLSPADRETWAAYAKTIPRLPGKTRLKVPAPPAPTEPAPAAPHAAPSSPRQKPAPVARLAPASGAAPAGLDKATWQKFAGGKRRAMARLDLHGHTAARAHHAVTRFIETAYAEQSRCIEIITGNGDVLARELPHWLNHPALRPLILAVAHPHAGNTGSLRILLRRMR